MMNFDQVDKKISTNGYRRHAGTRVQFNDETGEVQKIYDYEHKRKLDMFSVYVNEYGSVESVEFTRVDSDRKTGKITPVVTTISNISDLNRVLA